MDVFTNLKCILCFATWRTISHYGHVGNTRASRVMVAMRGDILAVCVSACLDYLCIGNLAWGLRLNNGSRMSREVHVRFCEGLAGKFRRSTLLIIGCEMEEDAQRVMAALPERFSRFKLKIHPEKTKMVRFKKPSSQDKTDKSNGTFDFLGFTHYWGKSLRGYWIVKRKTAGKRLRRSMKAIWKWCRENRHIFIKEQ